MTHASLFSNEHCNLASSSSRSCFLSRAAANSGSASAALRVFSSRESAASEVESKDSSASATVDSPDDEGVVSGGDDVDGAGDGALSNFSGEGETGSCLTSTRVGVWTAGREDSGPRETIFEPLTVAVAVAAVRAVFALAVCCFALFNTLWSTVNWIACAAGLVRR